MTEPNETAGKLRKYRCLIMILATFSSSTLAFTGGCAFTRYLTDSVKTQLGTGLIVAVLFPAVMLFLAFIRKNKSTAPDVSLSEAVIVSLVPFGGATLFFPRLCPEAMELLKQYIPLVVIDAVGVAGGIAFVAFVFLFWAKLLRQAENADS